MKNTKYMYLGVANANDLRWNTRLGNLMQVFRFFKSHPRLCPEKQLLIPNRVRVKMVPVATLLGAQYCSGSHTMFSFINEAEKINFQFL